MSDQPESVEYKDGNHDIWEVRFFGSSQVAGIASPVVEDIHAAQSSCRQPEHGQHVWREQDVEESK